MKHLLISLLCVCFLQVSFGQEQQQRQQRPQQILPPMTEEQQRTARMPQVSPFASPDWPGRLVPADSARMKKIDRVLPTRGLAIAAPSRDGVDAFCKFIEEDLAPAHFNMLIIRIDWNYEYECHPELRDPNPLRKEDIKKMVAVCKKHNIQLAPQINLLGHQSWAGTTYALLREYPEFDEAPHIRTEDYNEKYAVNGRPQPQSDMLYCKSYCPLHPQVHDVVFALVDELMDVFEAHWYHAGMDEVFHLGDERCPRCRGIDKAVLFAGEVNKIQDHLSKSNRRLMIWGDRLIDGRVGATGLGAWEASLNNTAPAIGMINKDVYICDWHYGTPGLSAVQIAFNGLDVALCPYTNEGVAVQHLKDMLDWRTRSGMNRSVANRFQGIIHTVWSGADGFLRTYNNPATFAPPSADRTDGYGGGPGGDSRVLKYLIEEFKKLNL